MEVLDVLLKLIEEYGYIIVTLAIMLESTGVPMPGETALVIAAAFAGAGHLNLALVITCAALGAIVGDSGGYWVGRRLGRPFLDKHGKWLHLTPDRMAKLEKLFFRHGPMTIFFGRFFTLLRTYAALFAGVWRMPYGTFMLYNALGGVVWAMCFGMLGYLFGQNLPLLEKIAKTVGWALTIPMVLVVACVLAWRWAVKHQEALTRRFSFLLERSGITYLSRRFSWQIHWFLHHWTAAQYTIMHITFGLIVASLGTWAFVRTAHSAFSDDRIARWDRMVHAALQDGATPLATLVFKLITTLGSYGVAVAVVGAILFFVVRGKWIKALSVGVVSVGGQLVVFALKFAFARPRLDVGDSEISLFTLSGFGFSFPSAHAMASLIVYGIIAYFIILWAKRWSVGTGAVLLMVFLVVTIGFSRLYLGVNYLSDVLCGLAGGLVWLSSCVTALELLRRGQVGDRRRAKRIRARQLRLEQAVQ
jgi:membrane protein DedA with SNARE-associated domain/membrane-associated phospholipid phosphatase